MIQRNKRIPTILAFLILFIGIGGGIFFAESSLRLLTLPDNQKKPQDIRITNKTSSMVTISWITKKETNGVIYFKKSDDKSQKIAFDDREIKQNSGQYLTHHVTLRNLEPNQQYEFFIKSDNKKYDNNGELFILKTFPKNKLGNLKPLYGRVTFQNQQPATGAIIYLSLERAEPLSTLVKSSGEWFIPLNIAYDSSSGLPVDTDTRRRVVLDIIGSVDQKAYAVTYTHQGISLPVIVMGEKYDFSLAKAENTQTAVLGEVSAKRKKDFQFSIIQPKDNQPLSTTRPLIRGKGSPGQKVTIIIESEIQSVVVIVDERGDWSWVPPKKLTPGFHTLTIKTANHSEDLQSFSRRFLVLQSGLSVLGEATPSGTVAPSPTPAVRATPTAVLTTVPTSVPTATPSLAPVLSPTLALTPSPTSVFATPVPTLTTSEKIKPGNFLPTGIFILLGLLLILLGLRPAFIKY